MKTTVEQVELTSEEKARRLGNDRKALLKRLREAVRTLARNPGPVAKWSYDFNAKTLTSPDGEVTVQWVLRRDPGSPEDYDNQQTSVGRCFIGLSR